MSVWFVQMAGKEFRLIDYYENTGYGIEHYAKVLKEKPYTYGNQHAAHPDGHGESAQAGGNIKTKRRT